MLWHMSTRGIVVTMGRNTNMVSWLRWKAFLVFFLIFLSNSFGSDRSLVEMCSFELGRDSLSFSLWSIDRNRWRRL